MELQKKGLYFMYPIKRVLYQEMFPWFPVKKCHCFPTKGVFTEI